MNFGHIFEYSRFEVVPTYKSIIYHDCIMTGSGNTYTHIELDPSDGTLTYYKNGVSKGKRWLTS
jgi:hypothetical protein